MRIQRPLIALGALAGLLSLITSLPPLAEAKKKRDDPEPEAIAPAEPAAPPAPALFPDGVPVATPALPEGLANLSAQSCNACHFSIHDGWAASAHADAWSSPAFQQAIEAAGDNPVCLSCHLPLAAQQPSLVDTYEGGPLTTAVLKPNPAWDATLHVEGVTCAACHVRDGVVVGTRPAEGAPHPVAVSDELASPEFCATCHQLTWPGADQPFYDTWGEWSRSPFAAAGVRCQDCHMPPASGLVTAGRYAAAASHALPAEPARALSVLVKLPPGPAVRGQPLGFSVTAQNTGAGHAFPTGNPFRYAVLSATLLDGEGEVVGEPVSWRFAREVDPEPPFTTLSDTRLGAAEQRTLEGSLELPVSAAAGRGHLVVSLSIGGPDAPGQDPILEPVSAQKIPLVID